MTVPPLRYNIEKAEGKKGKKPNFLTKPVCCKRMTPQTSAIKQPKSDSSAAESLLNCLHKSS